LPQAYARPVRIRRLPFVALIIVLVACIASASVAAPPPIPKLPPIAKLPSGYNFKARVDLSMKIFWVTKQNPSREPCVKWTVTDGVWQSKVHAYIPGHFSPTPLQPTDWANFQGVGKVYNPSKAERSTSYRAIAWSGGIVWPAGRCNGTRPRVVQPSDDCDEPGKPRDVVGQADFRASRRSEMTLLEDIVNESVRGRLEVVSVDVPPGKGWYRKCSLAPQGLDYLFNLAFELDADDIKRLKQLGVNEAWRYGKTYRQDCADDIPDEDMCTFSLSVGIALRRIKPRERYPGPWPP
jgi:hypothetical protein